MLFDDMGGTSLSIGAESVLPSGVFSSSKETEVASVVVSCGWTAGNTRLGYVSALHSQVVRS